MDQEPDKNQPNEPGSLETPQTLPEQSPTPENTGSTPISEQQPIQAASDRPAASDDKAAPSNKSGLSNRMFRKLKSLNIYLLLFILIVTLALFITFIAYQRSQESEETQNENATQSIDDEALKQLRNTDVSIGDPKQILSVEANAVFAGSVLVRGGFETAGQIKTEGSISTSSINVAGPGTFQTLQANKLQLAGDGQIQGNLTVQNSLSVSGSGNFGGTLSAGKLNVQSLELGGNLVISKHIDTAGGTPSRSNGSALGGGGTTSISGTDTAGTININTGSGPSAGCFINVNFTQSFGSTPHVVVTPVGGGGSGLKYYVTRSAGGFSLCTSSSPSGGKSFAFDYIVIN